VNSLKTDDSPPLDGSAARPGQARESEVCYPVGAFGGFG